jgi:hypothetical protein
VRRAEITVSTELAAPPKAVWARVASFEGINYELAPWMRMTAPSGVELSADAVPLGRRWFRSWILLFGFIPFDYDDLCVEWLEAGRGFLERSTMLSAPVWEHARMLEPLGDRGTRVTDRVAFEPRVRAALPLQRAAVAATFRHRHRRLKRYFGSAV